MRTLSSALKLEKNALASTGAWLILLEFTLSDSTIIRIVRNTDDVTFESNTYTAFPFEIEATKQVSKGEIPTVSLKAGNVTRVFQSYLESLNGAVGSTVRLIVVNSNNLTEDYVAAELDMYFEILATSADEQWVTMTLGTPNPLRKRFPQYRFIADHCMWRYNFGSVISVECGYTYTAATLQQRSNAYTVGNRVYPTTGSESWTFRCFTAGTTASTTPSWINVGGATVTDGTVDWVNDIACKRTLSNCEQLGNDTKFGGFIGISDSSIRIVR